jgi:hypothetical protein
MRIVTKEEFYKLPSGTIYSEYKPIYFRGLFVKGSTSYRDGDIPYNYSEMSLICPIDNTDTADLIDILTNNKGESIKLDFADYGGNDAYDPDQLYAIYEKRDLEHMLSIINNAIRLQRT